MPNKLLLSLWGGRNDTGAMQRIGHALKRNRDRTFGQWVIKEAGRDSETNSLAYQVISRKNPETPDENGKTTDHIYADKSNTCKGSTVVPVVSVVLKVKSSDKKVIDEDELSEPSSMWSSSVSAELVGENTPKNPRDHETEIKTDSYQSGFSGGFSSSFHDGSETPEPDDDLGLMIGTPRWARPVERQDRRLWQRWLNRSMSRRNHELRQRHPNCRRLRHPRVTFSPRGA